MKSGAARTFQEKCLAIECAQTLIAFARPQTKRSKHNRKDRQENERENATCGALIALVLDPHKRDAYSRHTLLAGLALEFAAARAATSKRAIRKLSFSFLSSGLARWSWIGTRNCQFGWFRGTRNLLRQNSFWLQRPDTYRIHNF
jgi:hypothetical protein